MTATTLLAAGSSSRNTHDTRLRWRPPSVSRWVPVTTPALAGGVDTTSERAASDEVKRPPSFAVTLATILFPVVLMLLKALADIVWDTDEKNKARVFLDFIGEPLVALFLAVLLAMVTFGYAVGFDGKAIADRIGASLGPIAAIILIVGACGGFKQTLIGAGVGDSIARAVNNAGLSSTTRASGWSVRASSSVGDTVKTWSVMETLISVVGFGFVSLLWLVT